jgi:Rhodopirellula transposase DDE domain
MKHETAGDPMTGLKWTRRTTAKVAAELSSLGIGISDRTVARLLKKMEFSLRVNHKQLARVCKVSREERNAQFLHISELRKTCAAMQWPLISVDTKKKEMIGQFKNAGASWNREPTLVNDHDFLKNAVGIGIPYGIYEALTNHGTVVVGTSRDTPAFAVDCIELWWRSYGRQRYPHADRIVIIADAGGSNGPTCRAWKYALHSNLCQRYDLTVIVAHYPSGASKWNPIEHRLFSEISKSWAARPLDSYETMLNYIQTTRTRTGLKVTAHLLDKNYEKGVRVSDEIMRQLPLASDSALPRWNYALRPS